MLYVGAEYCPFCAMERWALIGALSRFGTFSGLKPTTSSSHDVHPDTPTLSFDGREVHQRRRWPSRPSRRPTASEAAAALEGENAAIFQKFNPGGGIPWITYGGTHATNGATVDANVLDGKTYDQIIAGIEDPTSDIGKTVNPAINMITAQLCELTGASRPTSAPARASSRPPCCSSGDA